MAEHRHIFPILKMSRVFGVSTSGYYRWLNRAPSKRSLETIQLKTSIKEFWQASKGIYGAPRIHQQLLCRGWGVSRARVARTMKKMGIASRLRKKWVATTNSRHPYPVASNVLNRRFNPSTLNQVWVSDITYLPTQQGWVYLTMVMDLADRQIVGWALSRSMNAQQTSIACITQALARRGAAEGTIFHSDRGSQYACGAFTHILKRHGLVQSMARKGNCWDNAPAESFFKTLKAELLSQIAPFRNYADARAILFNYIEVWYNRQRLHSSLGYKTPIQAEKERTLHLQPSTCVA